MSKKKKINTSAVLYRVPLDLMYKIREYHKHENNLGSTIKWRARDPKPGKKVGRFGELKFADAKSADMYVEAPNLENIKHLKLTIQNLENKLKTVDEHSDEVTKKYKTTQWELDQSYKECDRLRKELNARNKEIDSLAEKLENIQALFGISYGVDLMEELNFIAGRMSIVDHITRFLNNNSYERK